MRRSIARLILAAPLALAPIVLTAGCEARGPAERAGRNLDDAGRNVRDAVDPPSGPGEATGRAIDDATR